MRTRQRHTAAPASLENRSAPTARVARISGRQRDRVVRLRTKGLSDAEVASRLSLSEHTVSEIWRTFREALSRRPSERKRRRLDDDGEEDAAASEARKLQKVILARPPTPLVLLEESDDELDVSTTWCYVAWRVNCLTRAPPVSSTLSTKTIIALQTRRKGTIASCFVRDTRQPAWHSPVTAHRTACDVPVQASITNA
jgi:DNA-binding CsgD family transcriptional regulator